MGRGAWRIQAVGGNLVETGCLATAASLDAVGAVRDGSRVDNGRTILIFDVSGITAAARDRAEELRAVADGTPDPVALAHALLADTMVGRFATAYYTVQRHARRLARGDA